MAVKFADTKHFFRSFCAGIAELGEKKVFIVKTPIWVVEMQVLAAVPRKKD